MRFVKLLPVALLIFATACGSSSRQGGPASSRAPTPAASAVAAPSAAPSATQAPVSKCTADFKDADATGGSTAGGRIVTVRVGTYGGYDRFVVEFAGNVSSYKVSRQDPTFVSSPKGEIVRLNGTAGVLVRLQPALDWTSYAGPPELQPGYPVLREARLIENFEGVQQWGLGVASPACLRVFTMDAPSRLIVDAATAK